MRILIASDLHWPTLNGIATFGRNLAHGLAADGHEVVVVAPSQTGKKYEEMDENHRVVRTISVIFPFYQNFRISLSPYLEVRKLVKSFNPDVIHVQTPLGVGLAAVAAAKRYHIPLVATNHAMSENLIENLKLLAPFAKQVDFILREYGSRFYSYADFVTLPTDAAISMLKPDSFAKPHRAISNGIELGRFKSGPVPEDFRERFGIPEKLPVVMYFGRLDAEKHVSVLVRAAHKLLRDHSFHLLVVGFGNDLEHLRELARDLEIEQHVTFPGRVDEADKPYFYRTGSIFVMPSPAELQSITTLEAMATALPVVAVNAGALHELCQDGRNGYLYKLDDADDLAGKLAAILTDDKLRERMSAESLAIAGSHDLKHVIREFEALYAQVITARQEQAKPAPAKKE